MKTSNNKKKFNKIENILPTCFDTIFMETKPQFCYYPYLQPLYAGICHEWQIKIKE